MLTESDVAWLLDGGWWSGTYLGVRRWGETRGVVLRLLNAVFDHPDREPYWYCVSCWKESGEHPGSAYLAHAGCNSPLWVPGWRPRKRLPRGGYF